MKFLHVAALLALVAIACSQPRPILRRCYESPPKWFGYFREVNFDAQPGQDSFRFANISYDRVANKLRVTEFIRREGDERFVTRTELIDYNLKKKYVVEEGKCNVANLNETAKIPDYGVPSSSTFYGADYLGAEAPGLGVLVDQFHSAIDGNDGERHYHSSYVPLGSARECIPVLDSYVNTESRLPSHRKNIHITFFNLTTVVSAEAFLIPKECP